MPLTTLAPRLTAPNLRRVSVLAAPPKQKAPIYGTPEFIRWRTAVVRRAGGMCEGCGRTGTRLFADHVRELRDGGDPFDLANGQALCGSCHSAKTWGVKRARAADQPKNGRNPPFLGAES